MAQDRHKQFEHDGRKLWAVFITAKSPDIKSFVIQDEALRLPTLDEAESLAKKMKLKGLGVNFAQMKEYSGGGSATVAFVRFPPLATLFLWQDASEIPLPEVYLGELSRQGIAVQKLHSEVVLIRKWKGQAPNDRSTGNESGE